MVNTLTRRETEALEFIKKYTEQHGYSPTVREIGEAMKYSSTSTTFGVIERLRKKGYIGKDSSGPRTIRLVEKMAPSKRIYLASSWKNAEKVIQIKKLAGSVWIRGRRLLRSVRRPLRIQFRFAPGR
ncbi:hypothetical protein LJK87_49945 [Paenibacillus sp. P25]|nr:hypothetical protein LJK87_49945 [Paenibacillus sp. P25]